MNSRVDTVVTFPHFARTHRLYSVQSYPHLPKNFRPKEDAIEERQQSTHYELQKSVPTENAADQSSTWLMPYTRGFFVQVGQKGQKPIDTDFILRISPRSRLSMSTTVPDPRSTRKINDVRSSFKLPLSLC